ncbi:MAG: hypothetical protein IPF88_18820 [Candidatus Microthrix sp.]|nr:hypothetical protein [Candidatus Microthrix sp.]MBK6440546.1 hypothetical protein [Candidatus Microthrix sp.]
MLVTMWAEDVPSARPNLLTALAQRALPGAAQRADLAALGSSTPTSADQQVLLDLLRDAQRAMRMPVDPILDELCGAGRCAPYRAAPPPLELGHG